jgi:anthranilate phosphoribosyltransferase
MNIKHLLKDHAYQNIPLTFEEAYDMGAYALKGCGGDKLAQIQSITTLSALHTRATYAWKCRGGEVSRHGHRLPESAAEQIAGICAAVFDLDIKKSTFGFINPNVPYAMDNCGMGGDLVVTANVSTIAALIASESGIYMCKHGSPTNADGGRHGSSDFVSLLGINAYANKKFVEESVEKEGFGYTEALDVRYKKIHMQTHRIALLPHMNDIIGPITNPLNPKTMTRRVLGVNHLISPRVVADAYRILNERGITNLERGLFVRGFANEDRYEGFDEVSVCEGGTQVAELVGDEIYEYEISARDFGIDPVPVESISPPVGMSKGDFSLRILRGEIIGPPLEMILANASILFLLAGQAENLKEAYAITKDIFESGKVYEKTNALKNLLPIGE